jgi:hypothetical protein
MAAARRWSRARGRREAFDLAPLHAGAVPARVSGSELEEQIARHVDVFRGRAVAPLRLPQEAAPLAHDLQDAARLEVRRGPRSGAGEGRDRAGCLDLVLRTTGAPLRQASPVRRSVPGAVPAATPPPPMSALPRVARLPLPLRVAASGIRGVAR